MEDSNENETLKARAIRGMLWSYTGSAGTLLLRLVISGILARMVTPASYGLLTIALIAVEFATLFFLAGVGHALVQKRDISQSDMNTAFTLCLLPGASSYLLLWIGAPYLGQFFNKPEVVPFIRVSAVVLPIRSLSLTCSCRLQRDLNFRVFATMNIVSYVVAFVGVGLVLASLGFQTWSLVYAVIVQEALNGLLAYRAAPGNSGLGFSWTALKPLARFGGSFTALSLLDSIGTRLNTLLIGRSLNAGALGIYNRADMLVSLPTSQLLDSINAVLIPSFSRLQDQPARLGKVFLGVVSIAAAVVIPVCVGMAVASDEIVLVLLGERWREAAPILTLLAVAAPFTRLTRLAEILCVAKAQLLQRALIRAGHLLFVATLLYAVRKSGLWGLTAVFVCGEVARHAAFLYLLGRMARIPAGEILRAYLPGIAAGLFVGAGVQGVACLMNFFRAPPISILAAEIAAGAVLLGTHALFGPMRAQTRTVVQQLQLSNAWAKQSRFISWLDGLIAPEAS